MKQWWRGAVFVNNDHAFCHGVASDYIMMILVSESVIFRLMIVNVVILIICLLVKCGKWCTLYSIGNQKIVMCWTREHPVWPPLFCITFPCHKNVQIVIMPNDHENYLWKLLYTVLHWKPKDCHVSNTKYALPLQHH